MIQNQKKKILLWIFKFFIQILESSKFKFNILVEVNPLWKGNKTEKKFCVCVQLANFFSAAKREKPTAT